MKRQKTMFSALLVLLLMLSGCQCKHTWTDADCLNPKVCTQCGETEGEALGHCWTDVSCEEASKCTQCGQIQGEPAGHDYGAWTFPDDDTMVRECASCGKTENLPLDRSVLLPTLLEKADWITQAEQLTLKFEDSAFTMILEENETVCGTWEFTEYQESPDDSGYHIYLKNDTGEQLAHAVLFDKYDQEAACLMILEMGNGYSLLEPDYLQMITGVWAPFWIAEIVQHRSELPMDNVYDKAGGYFSIEADGSITVTRGNPKY